MLSKDKIGLIQVESYESYGCAYTEHVLSLGINAVPFYVEKTPKSVFPSKKEVIKGYIIGILKMIRHFRRFRNKKILATGCAISAMFFSRVFKYLLGSGYHLYLYNFYLHSLGNKKYVKKILAFLMDNDKLTLIVQTPNEIQYYRHISDKIDLKFVPYCSDVKERKTGSNKKYIFTGGYTNRDYKLMSELAKEMPQQKFMFVASNLNCDLDEIPNNVVLKRNVSSDEFSDLMEQAAIVVVPLKEDVGSSGQMLCIQAMRYHKPIVYTDISAIKYYFTEKSGVAYQMGNLTSLKQGVRFLLDNSDLAKGMGDMAYLESLKYTSGKGMEMLDEIILYV